MYFKPEDNRPSNHKLFESRISIAGLNHYKDNAIKFIKGSNHSLSLIKEPNNEFDSNAIKIIGNYYDNETQEVKTLYLGYINRRIAEIVAKFNLIEHLAINPTYIYLSENNSSLNIEYELSLDSSIYKGIRDDLSSFQAKQMEEYRLKRQQHRLKVIERFNWLDEDSLDTDELMATKFQKNLLTYFDYHFSKKLTKLEFEDILAGIETKLIEGYNKVMHLWINFQDVSIRRDYEMKKISKKRFFEIIEEIRAYEDDDFMISIDYDSMFEYMTDDERLW